MKRYHSVSEKAYQPDTIFRIMYIYYPILAVVGVPVNVTAIVILWRGRCGLSGCITRYLLSMSSADLLVIISDVILTRLNYLYFPVCFLDLTPVCSLGTCLLCAATDGSVWLTVAFTFDRFLAICCQKLKAVYCAERTAAAVIGAVCALSLCRNIPWYFTYEPWNIVNNVPWFCKTKAGYYASLAWEVYSWSYTSLTPCLAFVLILLLNTLTARHILIANRLRGNLLGHKAETRTDAETVNRRKSIAILFSISGSFIVLWMTYVVYYLYRQITTYYSYSGFGDPVYVLYETGCMLRLLGSCTNTCIYAVTQAKFREELKKAGKYPFRVLCKAAQEVINAAPKTYPSRHVCVNH